MVASAIYGVLIGLAYLVLVRFAPQPAGSIVFWGFFAMQLTWFAIITWRRTGLPFATAAMAVAAVVSAFLALLGATGRIFPDFPLGLWIPIGIGLAAGPILFLIESRRNREKWQQWQRYMAWKSLWDILTARHIPDLRNGGLR